MKRSLKISISFISGGIVFTLVFILAYGLILTLIQILNLEFLMKILSILRREHPEDTVIIISTVASAFAEIGIVFLINKNSEEYIKPTLKALSISGIVLYLISLIYNQIFRYDNFTTLCFLISNIAIYKYAISLKERNYGE